MTNGDRIRSMTDDELFDFLQDFEFGDVDYSITFCDTCRKDGNAKNYNCDDCLKDWIKSDSKEYRGIDYRKE